MFDFFTSPQFKGTLNDNNASIEQEKYMHQIAKLTRSFNPHLLISDFVAPNLNQASTNPKAFETTNLLTSTSGKLFTDTPITNRRSIFASKIEKAVNTIKNINNPSASMSSSSSENIHPNNNLYTPNSINNPITNQNCRNSN